MAKFDAYTVARFWAKVDSRRGDACWEWKGGKCGREGQQYGTFSIAGKMHPANRIAWEMHNNQSLGERIACHTCDNPVCCNPAHIYAGTHKTNRQDAMRKGRAVIPTGEQRWRSRQDSNLRPPDSESGTLSD